MSNKTSYSWMRVLYALMLLALLVPASAWDERGQAASSPEPGVPHGAVAGPIETPHAAPPDAILSDAPAAAGSAATAAPLKATPAASVPLPAAPLPGITQPPTVDEPSAGQEADQVRVEPAVAAQIQKNGTAGYLLYFRARPSLESAERMDWIRRGRFVAQQLQSVAQSSQKNVRAYLDSRGVPYQSFWIDNVILVEASDASVFDDLKRFPEIGVIRDRRTEILIEPAAKDPLATAQGLFSTEPNIAHVQAPEAWALGINGQGSVVGSIDTGVRYTHQALIDKYRGNLGGGSFNHNYSWFDPYGNHPTAPADDNGHGSHTMGTMVGDDGGNNQIGMAPGAKWMACRGCNSSSCTDVALLTCAQFMLAPWDLNQANPNPDMRPYSVNNSWGDCGQSYDPWFRSVVDSWRAAGIYPVFSSGNSSNCGYTSPPACGTVGNPARYGNVTGVGATGQQNGAYATFSNRGPTDNVDAENGGPYSSIKPQVAAPGSNIRSSVNSSDTAYEGGWSGTSMAAPHVTGLTALIFQAAPCLKGNFTAVENILQQSAAIATGIPGACSGEGPAQLPNQSTGWGEIRALAAAQLALTSCGPTGVVDGTVTAAGSGDPIAGAIVQAAGTERTFETRSNAAGQYSLNLPVGTYTVNFSAYGYLPASFVGQAVTENATTTVNAVLQTAPSYTVSGKAWDPATGWGLYARITIDGYPGAPIWTDPATGNYSVSLVAGQDYTLHAQAFVGGYLPAALPTGVLGGDLSLDLPLQADANNCVAPGYALDVTGVLETFESATFPPAGWTVTQSGGNCAWVGNDPGSRGNLTGGTGKFAIADADKCGSGTAMNTTLTSPAMDVSTLANVKLSYNYDYNNLSSAESADLDVSADNGATWTNVHHWNTDMRGPNAFARDVTALLGGSTQAQLRFHYIAPGWDWWWQVDNVFVGSKVCHPIAGGGLVVGRVADANDNQALVDAKISSDTGGQATASATADAAMGDFYALFQPAGDHLLTATKQRYSPATANVSVPAGSVIRQDFALQTGHLTYTPAAISQTIPSGSTITVPVTVQNVGGGPVTFILNEVAKSSVPFSTPPAGGEPRVGLTAAKANRPVKLTTGPWQPTSGNVSLEVDDGTMEDSVGVNSSTAAYQFIWLNRFTPAAANFPFQLETVSVVWPSGQVAPGNAMQIVVYEDTDGDGDPSNATLLYSQNVTVQTADENWNQYTLTTPVALTGPGDVLIGFVDRFVTSGATPPNYPAAIDETSSAGRSWVGWWNTDPPATPALPPDNTFATVDSLGLPGNWMIRGTGTSGGVDVPWLSESPTQVTLGPGESTTIDVTLDGTGVAPGDYRAELRFVHDTPYAVANLPVRMVASIPPTMGKLAGTVSTNGACDNNPAPLANVPITINSAAFSQPLVLQTDQNGYYYAWLDQSASPLTVDVNAGPDYATGSATGVILNGGQITIQDFTLRYLKSCVTATPGSMLVRIPLGTSTTRPLTLRNAGGGEATFTFENTATGYVPPATQSEPVTIGGMPFSHNPNPPTASSDPNGDHARKVNAGSTTITQSNSQTITSGNSVSCNAGGLHTDNHYLRVFDLPTFGISSDFAITSVSFGVESSTPASSTQPVHVRLYTLNGAFQFANLTPIGSATAAVTSQSLTILDVPVAGTAPAGSKLVVDVFTPNGQAAGNSFFIGSNGLGETGPSYMAAADCGAPEPATTASLGFPEMMIVMNVTGMTGGGGPATWLSEAPSTGTVASDSMQPVVVTFDANKVNVAGTYRASAKVILGNSATPGAALDVETTMVVTAPANWGTLKGTINGLGQCDANPGPLSGASVVATGSNGMVRTATTGANGSFEFTLPDYGSPYTLEAAEAGHLAASAGGIVVTGMGTTTQDLSLRWMQPCVTETPPAISATVDWQQSTTVPMTLANTGAAASTFKITELPGHFTPMGVTGNQVLIVNDGGGNTNPANAFKTAMDNLGYTYDVVSSSSSTGIPATMTNYLAVLYAGVPSTGAEQNQLMAYLDAGGRLVIADNDFGYSDKSTVLYQTYFQATYVADAGSDGVIHGVDAMAGIDVDISSDPYPDSFKIGPDAIGIFANTAPRVDWAGMRIARQAYKAVYFPWDYHYAGGSAVGDAVETEILGKVMPWLTAADVDWLTAAPDQGNLAANTGSRAVNVTLNSTAASVLQPGTYTAQLKIETQDAANPTIMVPVSMTVNPAPTYGRLWGTVRGLGACDANPAPLKDAVVNILVGADTITLNTDANGYYQYWFTAAYPTIGLQVTAAGHLGESRATFFWPGADPRNQEDFDLHWQQPCGAMTPATLSATLTMGESTGLDATISNTGWAPLNFSFRGAATGFVPMAGSQAGEDVLLVASSSTVADAVAASLARLGYTYNRVAATSLPPVGTWTGYSAVIWAGSPSGSTNTGLIKSYLDAGGSFLITYNDLGYFYKTDTFYTDYLEATYGTDAGSDGPITGADIMAGVAIDISADPYPDNFTITGANAVEIFTNTAPRTGSAGLRIAKNAYKAIYLAWNFNYTGTTNAEKDQVLQKALNWLAPGTTWIQAVPASGVVAEQAQQAVTVTLNSADPAVDQPGTYQGVLRMSNNTPGNGSISVPVTMTVNPPATWGRLQGTVNGKGYCDASQAALANAVVTITAGDKTVNLKTDAQGHYSYWFDSASSPVSIAVNAVDHETGNASATIGGGQDTTQDFSLRWLKACGSVVPTSFGVTVPAGGTLDQTLTLFNRGAAATDWEVSAVAVAVAGIAQPITTEPVPGAPHNGAALTATKGLGEPNTAKSTPPSLNGPVELVADDGTAENSVGVNDSTSAYQFVWMNRFSPAGSNFPFRLEQVSILWPAGQVAVGGNVELVIYQDTDGDGNPTNAQLMGTYSVTIQHADGATWDMYTLATPLLLGGPGDVLIGAVNRWVTSGVTPAQWPANIDTTASQGRSWIGWWNTDPPTPPALPPDNTFGTIDSLGFAGNWMIRAGGTTTTGPAWLTVEPTTGNLAADGQANVTVHFNAAAEGVATGVYQAALRYQTADPVNPTISIPVTMTVGSLLTLTKAATEAAYFGAGEVLHYELVATNVGNAALTGVSISDSKLGALTCTQPVDLAPGGTLTCTGTYTTQDSDLKPDFTGAVVNSATANAMSGTSPVSATATATVPQTTARFMSAATTCQMFNSAGAGAGVTQLAYTVKKGKISAVTPTATTFFEKLKATTASFTLSLEQSNSGGAWVPLATAKGAAVTLYSADCTRSTALASAIYNPATGALTATVNGATPDAAYILGVRYSPASLVGTPITAPNPTVTYSFVTKADGTVVPTGSVALKVTPR